MESPSEDLDASMILGGTERIVTAVRCRPMSYKELREDDRPIVLVDDDEDEEKQGEVIILDPTYFSRKRDYERSFFERSFRYDHSFLPDSSQENVYDTIGKPLLKHSFEGYNSCLFVYGQTGSGKTYTMVGDQGDRSLSSSPGANVPEGSELEGVVPRLCRALLHEVFLRQEIGAGVKTEEKPLTGKDGLNLVGGKVLASFYEIYNERVFDLLSDSPSTPSRVREHPESGAFVDGLHRYEVKSYSDADGILNVGLEQRAVAETRMNKLSSRSHAVFTLYLMQKLQDPKHTRSSRRSDQEIYTERTSKVILVDLAGSERVSLTGATGERLVEANNINKSLSTLSDVIKALSDKGAALDRERERLELSSGEDPLNTSSESLARLLSSGNKANSIFVPYRNSVLTWLLKDCLGGHARTSMLANISPSESSYNETMSTLRYVEKAKLIMSTVRVNETSTDPAFVMQLQKHIVSLQDKIGQLNKAQGLRDAEMRMHLDAQEKELESEFIRRTIELQDQLHYYKQASGGISPVGSPADKGGALGQAPGRSLEAKKQEIALLTAENSRLRTLLEQKEEIISEYEDKFLRPGSSAGAEDPGSSSLSTADSAASARSVTFATPVRDDGESGAGSTPLSTTTNGSTSKGGRSSSSSGGGGGGGSMGRMRNLVLGYKKEKNLIQQQYEALLVTVRETTARVESGKEHMTKLDVTKNTLQADLGLSRADRNRLKSELATKVEECNTYKSEMNFYRARIEAFNAESKRKTGLLELHIARMKEAEGLLRQEKEEQMDRITELMAEREHVAAQWEAKLNESSEDAADRIEELTAAETSALRAKEVMERALKEAREEVVVLSRKHEEVRKAHAEARNVAEKRQEEIVQSRKQHEQLSTKHSQAEHQLEKLREQVIALETTGATLDRQVKDGAAQIATQGGEIARLTKVCEEKDTELGRDRHALHKLHETLLSVERESEEAENRMKDLTANFSLAIKKSDEELELLHTDCSKRVNELTALKTRSGDLAARLEEKEEEIRRRDEAEAQYSSTVEELRKEVAEREAAHADAMAGLRGDVQRSEEHARAVEGDSLVKSKGLFGQLDKLQQDIKISEERHASAVRELEQTKKSLESSNAALEKARAEIDKDEHQLEDKAKEHEHDVSTMDSLRAEKMALTLSLTQKETEAKELDKLARVWEEECNEASGKLKGKEKELQQLAQQHEEQRVSLQAGHGKATAELAQSMEEAAAKAQGEIDELRALLQQSRSELEVDHDKEEKIIGEKDRQLGMRKEAMRAVSEQLSKTEDQLEEARAAFEDAHTSLQKHQKQAEESAAECETLRGQLRDTEGRLDSMTDTAQNADDVIVKLNRQIKSLQAEVRDGDTLVKDLVRKHEQEKEENEFLKSGGGSMVAVSMRQQMDEMEEDRTDMMVELQEEREKEELLEKVAEELESENMRIEKALKEEKEKEAALERALAAEREHERQLEADLEKEKEHERQLEEALAREKELEAKLQSELDSTSAKLRASEERESRLEAKIRALSSYSSSDSPPAPPSDDADSFAQQVVVAELREKLANAESAGEALSLQVPELQQEVELLASQRDKALKEVEELQGSQEDEISDLRRQLEGEEAARLALEKKLKSQVTDAVQEALQGQLERNADLEADLEERREAQVELDMVTDVYKSEIAALTSSVEQLTAQLSEEREKVQKMVSNVDGDGAVVLSVQKQDNGGGTSPDSPGRGGASAENDIEAITMSLIEAKMALAHESSEKHELENQLQQTEKSNRALSTEVGELKLQIGSITASLKAAEIAAKKK